VRAELGRRIAFTLCALLVFRLGSYIPIPGIDPTVWAQLARGRTGGDLGLVGMFPSHAIHRLSIFALSVSPYIAAAIIVQLLLLVYPKTTEAKRREERGRRTIARLTLGMAALFAAFQSWGIASGLEGFPDLVGEPGTMFRVSTVATLTGGTLFLVWLCDRITMRGVGNGLALILFVGIVLEVPNSIALALEFGSHGVFESNVVMVLAVLFVALVGLIVVMECARRHVRVEFAGKEIGPRVIGAGASDLLLKLNSAGVIPVLVASWILYIVLLVADLVGGFDEAWVASVTRNFGLGTPGFMIATTVAIVVFTFLYTAFVLDPEAAARRLRAYGGVIPGIEPGEATAAYLDQVVSRTTILGSVYLALIALIPELAIAYFNVPFYFGGVSALVVVCVVLDISAQVRGDGLVNTGG
jgi:preprotein translocase subunit SecY